jgi:hypothetical protein
VVYCAESSKQFAARGSRCSNGFRSCFPGDRPYQTGKGTDKSCFSKNTGILLFGSFHLRSRERADDISKAHRPPCRAIRSSQPSSLLWTVTCCKNRLRCWGLTPAASVARLSIPKVVQHRSFESCLRGHSFSRLQRPAICLQSIELISTRVPQLWNWQRPSHPSQRPRRVHR